MDDPFPRTLGNRAMHSLSLQRHLHEQMQSNSELCDVTLVVNQVVSQMDIGFTNIWELCIKIYNLLLQIILLP